MENSKDIAASSDRRMAFVALFQRLIICGQTIFKSILQTKKGPLRASRADDKRNKQVRDAMEDFLPSALLSVRFFTVVTFCTTGGLLSQLLYGRVAVLIRW